MIIGHGDIASVLPDHPGRCYFAAGVSNSAEIRPSEFHREARLLSAQPTYLRMVYFSSLCIYYSDTPYARHKRLMEAGLKHDLWILGEGPQRSHLEGYIRQHHLEGSVRGDGREAADALCGLACSAPQPSDEYGALRRIA